ncbi:TPA: hypothetical protein ACH3X1_008465 [Trebouxia sp. C0004]
MRSPPQEQRSVRSSIARMGIMGTEEGKVQHGGASRWGVARDRWLDCRWLGCRRM